MSPLSEFRQILEPALGGGRPSRDQAVWLIEHVDTHSPECRALMQAGDELTRTSSGNRADIHAQVGINVGPCPYRCGFCSFAAQAGLFETSHELASSEVVRRALQFVAEGANVIYLMTTGTYAFDRLLRTAEQVRAALPAAIPLVANTGDLDPSQAGELAAAGFQGAYHTVRMGEGLDTGIAPKRRMATMEAIVGAGLWLAYCVEPIGPEHSAKEIVDKIWIGKEFRVWFSGAMRRISVPGTSLAPRGMISEMDLAKIVAVARLAMGDSVRSHCTHEPNLPSLQAGANLIWAESGYNPRESEQATTHGRGLTACECGQLLREANFEVHPGPPATLPEGVRA